MFHDLHNFNYLYFETPRVSEQNCGAREKEDQNAYPAGFCNPIALHNGITTDFHHNIGRVNADLMRFISCC
jgi:hypothetical protein